jgi:NNP family nitrate/nitrite transporter-like MFS transporter
MGFVCVCLSCDSILTLKLFIATGGVTELIIGTILFPAFKSMYGGDASMAWRTVCIVPAIIAFVSGVAVYLYSDDSPKGNYSELKKRGIMKPVNGGKSLWVSATCLNTWLLAFIYACCFGVELTMNQAGSQYFRDRFGQSTETAAAISSMFGWLNLFSRGLGGILSDVAMARFSMKGRLWVLTILLAAQGAFVLIFANTSNLGGAIGVLIVFR